MEGDNRIDSTAALELTEETSSKQTRVRGGYTCCVPGCYSNNKRDTTLSFHKFPQDKPYRSKWINNIKKDFTPGEHHRVCSLHFRNGKKMGTTDVPVLFPLLPKPSFRKPPTTRPAPAQKQKSTLSSSTSSTTTDSDSTENSQCQTSESVVEKLQHEIAELKVKVEVLTAEKFCLQRFAGNDDDIRRISFICYTLQLL